MKKIIFAASLIITSISYADNATAGHVRIHYDGGKMCWMGWSGCKGDIDVTWLTALPKDVDPISIPEGYKLTLMVSDKLGTENRQFETKTFTTEETDNNTTITIPKQLGQYSQSQKGFVVYSKTE